MLPEREEKKIAAAISAAIHLYLQEETKAPPFIILPGELRTSSTPWRFLGRKDSMDGRLFMQMKMLKK